MIVFPLRRSVLANQDQLIQVFLNLVKNAAEAVAAFNSTERRKGKTIIRVRP